MIVIVVIVVLVFLILATNLAPDLARRVPWRRMDIGIGGIRPERRHQPVEVAGRNILRRRPDDTARHPCACHRAAVVAWAFRSPRWPRGEHGATKEDHN